MQNDTTARRVALEADGRRAASYREHDLHPFVVDDARHSHAFCRRCGRGVWITVRPMPNEVDIGGEAVALGCK